MLEQEWTRRTLLQRGRTALVAGGLAAGAGCAGQPDARNGDTPTPAENAPATGTPTDAADRWTGPDYGRWLPAPQTTLPVPQYQFGMTDLTEYADHVDKLPQGVRGVVENWQPIELDWRTVPLSLSVHGNNVIQADYDRGTVVSQVGDTDGWTETGTHEGYTLLQKSDQSKAIAVGADAIVVAHDYGPEMPAIAAVRGIVDTAQGQKTTYPGANAAVDAVMDEFDDGGFVHMWRPVEAFDASPQPEPTFDQQVGLGQWGRFIDAGATAVKLIIVFERAAAVDLARVRAYVDDHSDDGDQFAPWRDVGIQQIGQLVVIEGTISQPRQ